MGVKAYQLEALKYFEKFLKRVKVNGDIRVAYSDTTAEWRFPLNYRPLPTMSNVPYVCLRIPTGGGKTMVGGMSIERVNRSLLYVEHSLTVWLVPSEPIRAQTLKALRTPTSILYQSMYSVLGSFTVLDIEEALRVSPHVLNGSNTIIVATIQVFKQEETDRLNVYKQNGALLEHFVGITDETVKGNMSLVDALRMRHPFIIVDEAHNQGTPLAFETLARLEPCAILELTATPDRIYQPSNVLYSVSASVLNSEDMIKMPLELMHRINWQDALRDAIAQLDILQQKAEIEERSSGKYLRPIMLIQAERRDSEHETLTPEKVKASLIVDFKIPADSIGIATGAVDDITDKDILAPGPVRFVITVDKLREGWDCPFAYILCSFRNTSSSTAAEQVLGRILRMPHVTKKTQGELNKAYAFVTSANFHTTVENLKDGLVRNGFERQEVKDLLNIPDEKDFSRNLFSLHTVATFEVPELPEIEAIPADLIGKVEIVEETRSITLRGTFTEVQAKALQNACRTREGKEAIKKAVASMRVERTRTPKSPAENGEIFRIPLLSLKQGDFWQPFEESHLLQGDWSLVKYPADLPTFIKPDKQLQGGQMFLDQDEKIKFINYGTPRLATPLIDYHADWSQVDLVDWLDKNISEDTVLPDDKAAYVNLVITKLISDRDFTLDELVYGKFRLREALEKKIDEAKQTAKKKEFQALLLNHEDFITDTRAHAIFELGRYAFDYAYSGFTELPKHFYPQIGNLKADGEEFECALFLATQLEGVKFWVRNVECKRTSFSLQTSSDRFYPDFICQLENEKILAVEYKNKRDWYLPENIEKRHLGALWEERSHGTCLFIMPEGKDFAAIKAKVSL